MKERVILHSDMNCFYASVETMLNPALKGKAVAVCGSTENRHGIVLAKSQKAKEAGVKTGMANWQARQLCPGLIMVSPQYEQYLKYSKLARSIYQRYTEKVEPYGMDECWLDVTESAALYGSGMEIAQRIRKEIKEELGLSVSIGVSFCKVFAKLGSDMKKPDAVTEISRDTYKDLVWPLPAGELLFVGRATQARLKKYNIETIGDLAAAGPVFLKSLLGVNGLALWKYAAGEDESPVMDKDWAAPIKSVGHGITCKEDLYTADAVWKVMLELCQDVSRRLRICGKRSREVQISIRASDLSFVQFQIPLDMPTQSSLKIARKAYALFQARYDWSLPVRALSIRATRLVSAKNPVQMDFFEEVSENAKTEKLEECMEAIRRRFGDKAVFHACLLGDLKMADDNCHLVTMPGMTGR